MKGILRTTGRALVATAWIAAALTVPSSFARADDSPRNSVEVGLGWFAPDSARLDDGPLIRVTWGRQLSDRWRLELSAARASEVGIGAMPGADSGFDFSLFDVGARWNAASWSGGRFQVTGGVGWRAVSGSGSPIDDSPTVQLGLGLELDLGRRVHLRPEARWRFVDELADETADFEATVNLGVRF